MWKILVCDRREEIEKNLKERKEIINKLFKDEEAEIEFYVYKNREDFIKKLKNCDALLTAFLNIDDRIIKETPGLKCISVSATGYGNIDVKAASDAGIAVFNVREYCTNEVAEHTMALILALSRKIKFYDSEVQKGKWNYGDGGKIESLYGKNLAVFGFGKIGRLTALMASAFGMNIITPSKHLNEEDRKILNVTQVSKEEALKNADIITNHMPETKENKDYFSFDEFKMMIKHPYFINTGRGSTVNEDALLMALDNGLIKGAGIDVLKSENPSLINSPLLKRNNVLITPHCAFYSETSIKKLYEISARNILYFLQNNYSAVDNFVNKKEIIKK